MLLTDRAPGPEVPVGVEDATEAGSVELTDGAFIHNIPK